MTAIDPTPRSAGVVLPCDDLDPTVAFLVDLGFRLDSIEPADDPSRATLSGFGLTLHLRPDPTLDPGLLRLVSDDPAAAAVDDRRAPNGTRIEMTSDNPAVSVPEAVVEFTVGRAGQLPWRTGRAGMRYRDLVPGDHSAALGAVMIHIPDAGPVDDFVHYHRVAAQLIYCAAGWVEVVYEDQGAPFIMEEGDCVLQPPGIRHRVRESSSDLVVIEVSVPARYETVADHQLVLPNGDYRPTRRFGTQRFVRHVARATATTPWGSGRFNARRIPVAIPTDNLMSAWVIAPRDGETHAAMPADATTTLIVVVEGATTVECNGAAAARLDLADAAVIAPASRYRLGDMTPDLELFVVSVAIGVEAHDASPAPAD